MDKVVSNNSFLFIPGSPDFPFFRLEPFDRLLSSSLILDLPGESFVHLQRRIGIKFHDPHGNLNTITFSLNKFAVRLTLTGATYVDYKVIGLFGDTGPLSVN